MTVSGGSLGRNSLLGRARECEALGALAQGIRAERSHVLVLRGEAGVGKSALLDYLADTATGCRVSRASGVESEMELAYAGLHQLCSPMLDRLDHLPNPQRDALEVAFGMSDGQPPDRFLVSLGMLGLLSDAAEKRPLICLIDDAQWLDEVSAQVLAFLARRVLADPVALVFAVRDPSPENDLSGLPELRVSGLNAADSRALLDSTVPGRLDLRVRDRIIAETRGNPLALLELPRDLTVTELAGGFGLPSATSLAGQIEQSFLRRVRTLPERTQRLLLMAAAEPMGDVALLTRAAQRLGMDVGAVAPAEAAGLIELDASVRFRHPLVRSAAYRSAPLAHRQEAHRALAEATDPEVDPDRRAWHRARSVAAADDAVADELERSADRAQARGGIAAAAAFLARSAELTAHPPRHAERSLAAAVASHQAGAFESALVLLAEAEAGPLDELGQARAALLRGQVTFASGSPSAAVVQLLDAASRLEQLHPRLARETYRDAFYAALTAGRLSQAGDLLGVATAARAAPAPPARPRGPDLPVEALSTLIVDGYGAGTPLLQRAVSAFREQEITREEGLGWLPLACRLAHDAWDDQSWEVLSALLIELARETGALGVLPIGLLSRVANRVFAGDFAAAASLAEEVETVRTATGRGPAPYGTMVLAAWRGDESTTLRVIEETSAAMVKSGEGQWLTATEWATAVLYNGLGRYDDAYAAVEHISDRQHELGLATWASVELVEAAARSGRAGSVDEVVQRFTDLARHVGTDWALGTAAIVRALVADAGDAEVLYLDAIDRLQRTSACAVLARVRLLYGEWLRREGRRLDAREQLRSSYEMLADMGAAGFTERARRELVATGETVRKRSDDTRDALTAQESQIVALAADGLTNPEIGGQLFISARTVEWHLRKVYSKLGISSRKELRRRRGASASPGQA